MTVEHTKGLPRRDFVRRLPVLTAGIAAGVGSLPLAACAGTPYVEGRPGPTGLAFGVDAVGPGGVFVTAPGLERPLFVSPTADGGHVAVVASCTHRGCQPEPVGDRLVCPCHGSEFSFDGEVLSGPADQALPTFPVETANDEIVVRIGGAP